MTSFLPHHPGGSKIILQLAGQDATEEYDPVHPPGTLEEHLPPGAKLGTVNGTASETFSTSREERPQHQQDSQALESLLNISEVEEYASKRISRKAWAYYFSAGDDLVSKELNNQAYRSILLRPRIFIDCEKCDTSTKIIGQQVNSPIYVSPAAMARLAHPKGEAGIAAACANYGILQVISQNASLTPEQIVQDAEPGHQAFGWQLYVQIDTAKSEAMIARINRLSDKIKFIVLTLDAPVPGKREHDEKAKTVGATLAVPSAAKVGQEKSVSGGIGAQLFFGTSAKLTWERTLPWLAKHTCLPIVLKGIQTHEDAYLASLYAPQVKGIILSNHGGRALDTAPPPLHTLLEIRKFCPEVFDRVEVLVDGGIQRGTDVVKALCLGAKGVGIGRAPLWGLAGGVEGVQRVLQSKELTMPRKPPVRVMTRANGSVVLEQELQTAMRLLGAQRITDLGPQHVRQE